jgi:hypothetical protein
MEIGYSWTFEYIRHSHVSFNETLMIRNTGIMTDNLLYCHLFMLHEAPRKLRMLLRKEVDVKRVATVQSN